MDRDNIAYAMMLLMALAAAGVILYLWYHSHRRSYVRRQRRENRAYKETMAEKRRGELH